MTHLRRIGLVAASLTILTVSASGLAAFSGASESHVGFEATGPAGLKITGTTVDLAASEDSGNVVITVNLANLSTGIGLRDQHMRDKYLEVPKFPTTTLSVPRASLKIPAGSEKTEADVQGTLTLHGQSHPVTVHYDSKTDGGTLFSHGKFHVNMNDYGITVPSYLGVTVKPDVDVTASFRLAGN
jgi:polyisoprenoid-binding protein YceI